MQPDIQDKLDRYHALLLQWQPKINLISPMTVDDAWERHFVDSIQVNDYIPHDVKTIADIGSGAGFPALVLAIMRPDIQFHLVESDTRKCSFLRNVSRETQCENVTIYNARIENILETIDCDCLTARALASLKQLIAYAAPFWADNLDFQMVLPKGRQYQDEITDAKKQYAFEYDVHQSITSDDAVILSVSNIKAR